MADTRFFAVSGPFTLAQLAEISGATPVEGGDPAARFVDVAPLDQAGPEHVSFLDNKKYVEAFKVSKAGLCIVSPEMADKAPAGMTLLVSPRPYRAYAAVAKAYHPEPALEPWTAPTAWVDPSATVGEGCRIEPGAYVGAEAEIGAGCLIGPNAVVGRGVVLGEGTSIGANASVSHAIIGRRVVIFPGVRIGQEGFGFAMGSADGHLTIPQLGRVVIGDGVEIGANTTIDRGAGPDTIIGDGCRIDNLVQIAHNVQLGRGCVIVSQVGISGSTHLGDYVAVGGQTGITGHLKIGTGARIAAKAGVMRDVAPGETVGGVPAVPMADWLRQSAILGKMARKKG